jgi:hypothetical protein
MHATPEPDMARIERELEILRGRYRMMQWSSKIGIGVVLAGTAVIAGLGVYGWWAGEFLAIGVSVPFLIVLLIGFVIVWLHGLRWIDVFNPPPFAGRMLWPVRADSEARTVERMIAEREASLAQTSRNSDVNG